MNSSSAGYRQLLATVDLGEMTAPVVARASDLGRRLEADLDLVNIQEGMPVFLYHAVSTEELNIILDKSTRWSRERLEELKAQEPWIRGIHTASGVLAEEVRAVGERVGADLLVIGAHERHGMAVLLRDRSDEILHKAQCDVLVVKAREPQQVGVRPEPYLKVVAAVDLGEEGAQVAERAARVAALYRAELLLLHVIEHFPVDRSNTVIPPEDQDPLAFESEETVRNLCTMAQKTGIRACHQAVRPSSRTASREVPAYAEEANADLLVVGSHGPHGLGRLLGSTADGIVHRATCDVLVVRTRAPD